jgi:hypothetical protein
MVHSLDDAIHETHSVGCWSITLAQKGLAELVDGVVLSSQ